MTTLLDLPLEIFHNISQHLDTKTIFILCLINRSHYLYYYPFLFHSVTITNESKLLTFTQSLKNRKWKKRILGLNTKTLTINDTDMNFEQLMYIQSHCINVKYLTMNKETWRYMYEKALGHAQERLDHDLFYDMLKKLFRNYPQLVMLSLGLFLGMPNSKTFSSVLECLPNLKDLSLDNINLMEMTDIEIIHQCCPSLETLSFDGFCLLRKKPTPPIIPNSSLKLLKIRFSSGWSVYWDWLEYLGTKYTHLETLICICPTIMGVRNFIESATEVMISCNAFAKQHARSLKRLDLINLNLDISFYNALSNYGSKSNSLMIESSQRTSSTTTTATTTDESSSSLTSTSSSASSSLSTPSSTASPTAVIKELRATKSSADDSMAKFECIIDYVHNSIERLGIFAPTTNPDSFEIYNLFQKCIHLTDLTLHMPYQQRFFSDFDIDIVLKNCSQLIRLCILHVNLKTMKSPSPSSSTTESSSSTSSSSTSPTSSSLSLSSLPSTSSSTKTKMKGKAIAITNNTKTDHPLKELILKKLYITEQALSTSFSNQFNLCHLNVLHIKDSSIIYPSRYYDSNYYLKLGINLVPTLNQNKHSQMSIFIKNLDFTDHQGIMSPSLRHIIINEKESNDKQSWVLGVSNAKWKKCILLNPRRSDRLKAKNESFDSFTNNSVQFSIQCQSIKEFFVDDQQII